MTPSASTAAGRGSTTPLTREEIVERIRRWADLYGEPPVTADWNPSVARWRAQEWRIPRYHAGDPETGQPWPSLNAVKRRFGGSFDAAVVQAGLSPRRPGPPRRPGVARPAVAPRVQAPVARVDVLEAELAATLQRLACAEAQLLAEQNRAADALRRAERLQARLDAARVRARRAGDRARRWRAVAASRPEPVVHCATPRTLAAALRHLVHVRQSGDRAALAAALSDVSSAALAWKARL